MPEYAWMCLYKQDSEYTSAPEYAQIRNMAEFSMPALHSALNMPEYALIEFYARTLNMAGLWICKSCTGFLVNISQCGWICLNMTWISLNMSEFTTVDRVLDVSTIPSARWVYKLMCNYWEIGVFRTWSKI